MASNSLQAKSVTISKSTTQPMITINEDTHKTSTGDRELGSKLAPSKSIMKWRTKSVQIMYTRSDSSIYPSYTNLALPYRVKCRQRYQNAIKKHQAQFIKEICLHERLQPSALGGVRLRREFCDPVLKKVSQKDIITLTFDQERRLEYILKTDPRELQS